ncbi:hypothetical protein [Entomomonas asaccharolytica]|uniref:Uncharacterized protein n=1 Tax=Entomomonas asaccharolytica TaxID=2785331 RepID=A0A974RXC7_9GAMM|nr:hypothetical protein [Entomomonas asaccharolytica]QQP84709.1 hypothetical protein JHT90_09850 [Entomomonas asaccharolytica]
MKIKTLVTAILGLTLALPTMANTHSISQDKLVDEQKTRSVFMEDDNKVSSDSIVPMAGAGIVFTGSTSGGSAYYLDGRVVPYANDCYTTISGSMRIIVNVVDDLGQVDSVASQGTTNRWSAYRLDGVYKCGIAISFPKLNGAGRYEAVYERSGQSPVKKEMAYMPACAASDLNNLYILRRPSDTNFYMSIDSKEYSRAIANGFTEAYGITGKTLKNDKFNGTRKISIGMERYNNPVMTTHAASIDIRDQETHPAWQWDGSLGHIYTKQYNGTVPLYRAYGEYNPSDWEVGIATDRDLFMSLIYGSGWTAYGTPGQPYGVLGYVCSAN